VAYANGDLVDGGVASLVPARFARAMGADIVIAVDIYCQGRRTAGLGVLAVARRMMHTQSCLIAGPEMAEADILIAPSVSDSRISDQCEQTRAIPAGYEAARAALPNIASALREGGGNTGR